MDVADFLRSIDVFVYYHHPNWIEAFGRVIAEAMASGLPTILPHHFAPLFREGGIYAYAKEVPDIIRQLEDREKYAEASQLAKAFVENNFSRTSHVKRLQQLHPSFSAA